MKEGITLVVSALIDQELAHMTGDNIHDLARYMYLLCYHTGNTTVLHGVINIDNTSAFLYTSG